MKRSHADDIPIGKFIGSVAEEYRTDAFLSWLTAIDTRVAELTADTRVHTRNVNLCLTYLGGSSPLDVAVKRFGRQTLPKDWIDRKRGSKARRTWLAARYLQEQRVGTPEPLGFLEQWKSGRLLDSYFLSLYQRETTSFKEELIRLFRDDPDCSKFMSLMQSVAQAVFRMHAAGFLHNDLGNQNILLRRKGDADWTDIQFIDLNRSEIKDELSLRDRGRDISRIYLPSDLLRVFKEMYWGDIPPAEFQACEKRFRKLYAWHSNTRSLRHPVRTFRNRDAERSQANYPCEKDMWIWDERSGQPIAALRPADRKKFRRAANTYRIAAASLSGALAVRGHYNALLHDCYRSPVTMKSRVGMAISPTPASLDREISLLAELGRLPVLIRFCRHESDERHKFLAGVVADLGRSGYGVSISLVQDRQSVLDPAKWDSFAARVLDNVAGSVEFVELGHAINRVKWGLWDLDEHRRLLDGVAAIRDKHPGVRFIGPAVIDFEYWFLMAALRNVPHFLRFSALSHHLYVDRRGAPENRQGLFSTLEKLALTRAIGRWSGLCDDRLIVSEVNWPLRGTGVYSPVASPYESPGPRFNDPSVSEEDYASYMIRYLSIALCSGMAERVYWWRLVARGYGLVDDADPEKWRKRPAYGMLKQFLSELSESTFKEKLPSGDGLHLLMFESAKTDRICLAYSSTGPQNVELPFKHVACTDAEGAPIAVASQHLRVSGVPVYLRIR